MKRLAVDIAVLHVLESGEQDFLHLRLGFLDCDTTIRNALKRLVSEGCVKAKRKKGRITYSLVEKGTEDEQKANTNKSVFLRTGQAL